MRQDRDKSFRSYAARVRGKAETCSYTTRCSCDLTINFTDIIVKDVLIAGIADLEIRRDILGIDSVLDKSLTDVITLVESREMARNALPTPSSLDAISSFKKSKSSLHARHLTTEQLQTADCPVCKEKYRLFTEGRSGWNTKPHRQCVKCYKERRRRLSNKPTSENSMIQSSEVGGTFAQVSTVRAFTSSLSYHNESRYVKLAYHIFRSGEWRKAWSLKEKAMQCRMTRTCECEKLNEHTRKLQPLIVSDHVFIQNQHGAHPSKWDKSGKTIDVKPHSQYLVKVNRSGRVTVRNRCFLRKFTPAAMTVIQQPLQTTTANNVPSDSTSSDDSSNRYHNITSKTDSANTDASETEAMTPSPVKHVEDQDKQSDLTATTPARITTPAKTSPVPLTKSTDRPRRHRKPRQLYVPETGQWQPK